MPWQWAGYAQCSYAGIHGLTSHRELCTDNCEKRGYAYFYCSKAHSDLGQWYKYDFCSPAPGRTHYGEVRGVGH